MQPYSRQSINEDDIASVTRVLRSDFLTGGKEVPAFEAALASYVGVKYAVVFNSATSALYAAYAAAGIGEGDAVITSPISFVATSNMVLARGATPIFCDVKLDGNMDERYLEALITPTCRAIVPVDFGGNSVAMDAINEIAKRHDLVVIEDASHALGAMRSGVKVGRDVDMAIFSFHAIKPITTAEGGALLTNNETFAKHAALVRSHGIIKGKNYASDMAQMGFNFRMSDMQAALGRSQLTRLDAFIEQRQRIASYYDERFASHKLFSTITRPESHHSSHHLYAILFTPQMQCLKEEVFEQLQAQGIGVQVHYRPIHHNSYYAALGYEKSQCPVAYDFYRSELSIPCHQAMSLDDAKNVADTLERVLEAYAHRGCSF